MVRRAIIQCNTCKDRFNSVIDKAKHICVGKPAKWKFHVGQNTGGKITWGNVRPHWLDKHLPPETLKHREQIRKQKFEAEVEAMDSPTTRRKPIQEKK